MEKQSIIGIGGMGNNLIKYLREKTNDSLSLSSFDYNNSAIPTLSKTTTLIAGLGGNLGSRNIVSLSQTISNMGDIPRCIVTTPFRFEGEEKIEDAYEVVAELSELGAAVIVFNNQDIFSILNNDKTTFEEAFRTINQIIEKIILSKFIFSLEPSLNRWNFETQRVETLAYLNTPNDDFKDRIANSVYKFISSNCFDKPSASLKKYFLDLHSSGLQSYIMHTELDKFPLDNGTYARIPLSIISSLDLLDNHKGPYTQHGTLSPVFGLIANEIADYISGRHKANALAEH